MPRRHEPQPELGQAIRAARKATGKTQRQVATAADMDLTWYARLERGTGNPAWGSLRRIAAALDVRPSELVEAAEDLEKPLE